MAPLPLPALEDWSANCGPAPNLPADIWLAVWTGKDGPCMPISVGHSKQRHPIRRTFACRDQPAAPLPCQLRISQQDNHPITDDSSTVTEFINSQHTLLAAAPLPPPWRTIPTEVGPASRNSPAASSSVGCSDMPLDSTSLWSSSSVPIISGRIACPGHGTSAGPWYAAACLRSPFSSC